MSLAPESEDLLLKKCSKCGLMLPQAGFHRNRGRRDGLNGWCRVCVAAGNAEWARRSLAKNPNFFKERELKRIPFRLRRRAKERAAKSGMPFDLPIEWFEEKLKNGVCELTGVPFYIGIEPRHPFQPSPDRIDSDPAVGYVLGNVRMIAYMANIARQNYSDEFFAEHFLSLAEGLRRGS